MCAATYGAYAQRLRLRNDLILMTVLSGPTFSSWLIPFLA